jgi:hypothetical protein
MTLLEKHPSDLGRALAVLATEQAHESLPTGLPNSDRAKLPSTYQHARAALERCARVDECKEWADKALALASYAKQAKDDELGKMAVRIRARAIRRCGVLLKAIEPGKNQHHARAQAANGRGTRKDAARRAGLSGRQAKTALRVARVPIKAFEDQVESARPPTVGALARQGTPPKVVDLKGRNLGDYTAARKLIRVVDGFSGEVAGLNLASALKGLARGEMRTVERQAKKLAAQLRAIGYALGKARKAAQAAPGFRSAA